MINKKIIDQTLVGIAALLKSRSTSIDNVGLLKGQTGVAVFLFLYSRYAEDKEVAAFAESMIDQIMDSIVDNTPVDYADGLAGFGTGIEYLVRHGFLDADTDDVLEDLDELVGSIIRQGSCRSEIVGYGKYIVARLASRTVDRDSYAQNRESLKNLLSKLDHSLGSYSEMMGVIELLSELYPVWGKPETIAARIDRVVEELEASVRDDVRFGCYPGTFNPLVAAFVLLKAAERTGVSIYRNKARWFMKEYGGDFAKYLGNDSSGLLSGSFKWALLYCLIGQRLPDKEYGRSADVWLERCLGKNELSINGCVGMPVGVLDGSAGIGLSLLNLIGGISEDWTDIIPLYYERGKVTFTH